jgi:hypothetical protein
MIDYPGAAGNAILFISFTLLQIIISWLVFSYAAHCFLVVVQESAAGSDEVIWPDEPLYDWIWKLWYLLWLAGVWLIAAGLTLWSIDVPAFHTYPWVRPAALLGVFWLLFPVSLFSSLSAHSRWVLFRPAVLGWLLARFFSTTTFYILTALVLAGYATLFGLPLVFLHPMALPAVGALAPAFLLVYARLVGRMGLVLNEYIQARLDALGEIEEPPEEPEPKQKKAASLVRRPPRGKRSRAKSYDPWAVPEEPGAPRPKPPRPKKPGSIYRIQDMSKPPPPQPKPPKPRRVWVEEGADEPYALQPPPSTPESPHKANLAEVDEHELRLAQHSPAPPPPAFPLLTRNLRFLAYPATLRPLSVLALGGIIMGLVLWMQIRTAPF